jgi:5'-phosphate synthase pdxT subunit
VSEATAGLIRPEAAPFVGVLAIQGGFEAHIKLLERLGARPREVRTPADLEGLDALILPGGESTVMTLGIDREQLAEPLRALAASGTPILGTCAGMIILDRVHLGILDVLARRNAFGRQLHSFEADLELGGVDGVGAGTVRAVFIRAPWIAERGPGVEVLAEVDGHPVAVRQDNVLALSFHPELAGEDRVHRLLLELVSRRAGSD